MKDLHPAVLYFVQKPCTESWTISRSLIPFYDLTFVLSGSAEYFINDVPYRIRAGEAVLVPRGAARSARTQGMRCAAFNFTLPQDETLTMGPVIPFSGVRPIHFLLTEYSREWILSGQSNTLKGRGILMWLLGDLLREQTAGNPHIRRIKDYIADHIHEKITVPDAADAAGLSAVYCGALFKQHEGCTLLQYIQSLKIEQAVQLLQNETLSVGEIADLLGFEDIYYFSRVFKKIMGHSPLAERGKG